MGEAPVHEGDTLLGLADDDVLLVKNRAPTEAYTARTAQAAG